MSQLLGRPTYKTVLVPDTLLTQHCSLLAISRGLFPGTLPYFPGIVRRMAHFRRHLNGLVKGTCFMLMCKYFVVYYCDLVFTRICGHFWVVRSIGKHVIRRRILENFELLLFIQLFWFANSVDVFDRG